MTEGTHANAAFPTVGPIMVCQRTNNLFVGIGGGKRTCEGGPRRHGLAHESRAGGKTMGTAAPSTQRSVVNRCLEAGLGNSELYKGQLTE